MPRQTKAEIDAEILDCAAGIFARHGFSRTSIQQIADALGYSKAGLLHHYPSKKALHDAVLDRYETQTRERIGRLDGFAPGIERDRKLVEGVIDFAFTWPGMSDFAQQLARDGERLAQAGGTGDPRFAQLGFDIIGALGIDLAAPDRQRMARTFTALSGATFSARIAVTMHVEREWREPIVKAAMAALGH
ncbi:TetR/AcrR family transcriptional regulator [Sphingopyxis sp.]|jgi:AcrR family transcriptional regulator|uniref:TetR/AcrR family transcriptional regulator n=1 Tax=Sphingopyxis sp. TaxID=1908224 RepID=UPI0025DB065B|nr:TetR/AcrR family transcriptional regulator [Sphingopyxis sp.]MBK6413440.1 TetR/AcrR family transcriptional regulator [Sphingopyxis sp.]